MMVQLLPASDSKSDRMFMHSVEKLLTYNDGKLNKKGYTIKDKSVEEIILQLDILGIKYTRNNLEIKLIQ